MYKMGKSEIDAVASVLESQELFRYSPEAKQVDLFERELAAKFDCGSTLATSSGTGALICALAALGIGPGDEVIMPAYAYAADVIAILAVGGTPVVCDINESTGMDSKSAEQMISDRTKAIMPVHMCGLPSDMDAICAIAAANELHVVEDACQAIGGTFKGRKLGTIGDIGAFSFNQAKIITAGEGGAVLSSDRDLIDRAFVMHDATALYDGREFNLPIFSGLQFRMVEMTGAIMRVQLGRLDEILEGLASTYSSVRGVLSALPGVEIAPSNDPSGECHTNIPLYIEDEGLRRRVCDQINLIDGMWAYQGIALGHSYFEWEFLHSGRGAHDDRRNPLRDAPPHQAQLSKSRDILERTVFVGLPLELSPSALDFLGELAASL